MSKKNQIYDALIAVVNQNGFQETPVKQIAKEAGISVGSIYSYFEDKEDLIKSLYLTISDEISEMLKSTVDKDLSNKDQFVTFWLILYRFFIQQREKFSYVDQFEHSPYYSQSIKEMILEIYAPMVQLMKKCVDDGDYYNIQPAIAFRITYNNITTAADLTLDGMIDRETLEMIIDGSWDQFTIE